MQKNDVADSKPQISQAQQSIPKSALKSSEVESALAKSTKSNGADSALGDLEVAGRDFGISASELATHCSYDLQKDPLNIAQELQSNIDKTQNKLESTLKNKPKKLKDEQKELEKTLKKYEHISQITQQDFEDLLKTITKYDDFGEYKDFYTQKLQEQQNDEAGYKELLSSIYQNALEKWKQNFNHKIKQWEQAEIDKAKKDLQDRTKEWIELMKKFDRNFNQMGEGSELFKDYVMQSLKNGLASGKQVSQCVNPNDLKNQSNQMEDFIKNLFGKNADGKGKSKDKDNDGGGDDNDKNKSGVSNNIEKLSRKMLDFQKWSKILERDSVKKLCDMLGKIHKAQKKHEMEKYTKEEIFHTKIPTPYAKEEISGVTLGRDLENVLPQELALLDDKDFSILFDLKFAENRLFCFEKQGYIDNVESKTTTHERQKEVEDKKGPIILCIDTSGSMSGTPETIAKAIALFMAKRAMDTKRKCFLINFSVGIHTLDLTPPNGLFELMDFLEMSFSGGTDALPALRAGLKKMREENYKKADLLMISDFMFSDYSFGNLAGQKGATNKCYALYVGDFDSRNAKKSTFFDKEFYYNNIDNSIGTLSEMKERI